MRVASRKPHPAVEQSAGGATQPLAEQNLPPGDAVGGYALERIPLALSGDAIEGKDQGHESEEKLGDGGQVEWRKRRQQGIRLLLPGQHGGHASRGRTAGSVPMRFSSPSLNTLSGDGGLDTVSSEP